MRKRGGAENVGMDHGLTTSFEMVLVVSFDQNGIKRRYNILTKQPLEDGVFSYLFKI